MNLINKIAVGISALSVVIIAGSLYYNNDQIKSHKKNIEASANKFSVEEIKPEEVINKNNVEITTEVKENILVITLKNIAKRDLRDVVIEADFKNTKLGEIYLENFAKDTTKTIEIPLTKVSQSLSIKENSTIVNGFRLLEEKEFTVGQDKGKVLVTSLKTQTKEFYKETVTASQLEEATKEELISKINAGLEINEIENLFEKNGLIRLLNLAADSITFNSSEVKLVIEAVVEETPAPASQEPETAADNTGVVGQPTQPVVPAQPIVQPVQPVVPEPVTQPGGPVNPVEPAGVVVEGANGQ